MTHPEAQKTVLTRHFAAPSTCSLGGGGISILPTRTESKVSDYEMGEEMKKRHAEEAFKKTTQSLILHYFLIDSKYSSPSSQNESCTTSQNK